MLPKKGRNGTVIPGAISAVLCARSRWIRRDRYLSAINTGRA